MRAALAALALLLAGCTAPTLPAPPAALALVAQPAVRVLDVLAREPAIEAMPDGRLFVTGYSGSRADPFGVLFLGNPGLDRAPPLWTSDDAGATWRRVDVGTPAEGAAGNSDVDLAQGPQGELYIIAMTFLPPGATIAAGASLDGGATWSWSLLSAEPGADRPWVDVAPDGTVHAIWNAGRVYHRASSDQGQSWGPPTLVSARGGSSHLAVGPQGEVVVRVSASSTSGFTPPDPGADALAVSTDGGATWTLRAVPGNRSYPDATGQGGDGIFRWVEPLAFDAAGVLYHAWPEPQGLMLGRSSDLGATWDTLLLVPTERDVPFYPYLEARSAGEVAATWFSAASDGNVSTHLAYVRDAAGPAPRIARASLEPFILDAPGVEGTGGEYVQVAFDGADLVVATTVQDVPSGVMGFDFHQLRLAD